MKKIVINECYGGFSLSDKAYERLIEMGIPVREYIKQPRNSETGLYEKVPENEGEIIFDRLLGDQDDTMTQSMLKLSGRYWETWITRDDLRIVQVVEELGDAASGKCADLKVVEIPNDAKWQIEEYDGIEWIAEKHKTWR